MPATAKSRSRPAKQAAARKRAARPPALATALAEAAWLEADAALAEALIECDRLAVARDRAARAEALALLAQALARAGRKRGLARFGKIGAREAFDAGRHAPARATARAPKTVRILAQGVARGEDVLVKARVAGVRAKRP